LYSYSRNNPTSFFDPGGKSVLGIGIVTGLTVLANIISNYVMMRELLNYLAGYISTQRALATLINTPGTGAEAWLGTPYDEVGANSIIHVRGDCSGIEYKIMIEGGYNYIYCQANQAFIDSLKKGGINYGILRAIPESWAPQSGDIGYWNGHMCTYAYRKGGIDYVYNASEKAGKFQIQKLDNIVEYGFQGTQPVWFRLRR
jgi:hypothetical protein